MGICHGKFIDHLPVPTGPQSSSATVLVENDLTISDSVSANETPSPSNRTKSCLVKEASIQVVAAVDKNFGYSKQFEVHCELGKELGRGHFGYTCLAKGKKGSLLGQDVAVKVIPKSKMTTRIAIEDVRREVKILRTLTGHKNLVQFHDSFEDEENVYIVMELCEGGELLGMIISRGGRYSEEEAKDVMVQILSVVAFCHLQGVVHRDLKPENFLYLTNDKNSPLKAIDFGFSGYVKPDERLNDAVGSACYMAPEVPRGSYGTEADIWSIGVIAYILLCGSRPFWSSTQSGIFRAVLETDPRYDEAPWPNLSPYALDFVKRLLNKDYRKRPTAAQALSHPWLAGHPDVKIPLDMIIYRQVKAYVCSTQLQRSALGALAKTLRVSELAYLRKQFNLLEPNRSGYIFMQNFKIALMKNATAAMHDSRVTEYANVVSSLQHRKMDFDEFCAAAISVHQLECLQTWEDQARSAYKLFDKDGNRSITIKELESELGINSSVPVHEVLKHCIKHSDGKLSLMGFVELVHGVSLRAFRRS